MQIKIIFDSIAIDKRFTTGWGFACVVDNKILFDTGERPSSLLFNMKEMKIDLPELEYIVISHEHWDHTGGLWHILEQNPKIKVYGCPGFSRKFKNKISYFKNKLIETSKFTEITKNVYTTGEIEGIYKSEKIVEQALVLRTDRGTTIITGCAHPGIIKIIETVKRNMTERIYLVMGGFHLKDKTRDEIISIISDFKKLGINSVSPCHCTGAEAKELFKKEYNANFIECKIGKIIEI